MAVTIHTTPASATNIFMHGKLSNNTERAAFPYTEYDNVLSAPKVVEDVTEKLGAPFHLLITGKDYLTETQIRKLCGFIV